MLYNFDDLNFKVLSVNRISWKKAQHKVEPRPFAALAFRVKGSGLFNSLGNQFVANTGDILFCPASVGYDVEYTDGEIIVIHFSECNYVTSLENYQFKNYDYFYSKFSEILENFENGACIYKINYLIFRLLNSMRERSSIKPNDTALINCVNEMNENYSDVNLSISALCKKNGISEASLRRKFHQAYSCSPKEYLLKLKLDKAVSLLAENTQTVQEIATLCGFSDEKYFSRIIKQRFSASPSALRKKLKL